MVTSQEGNVFNFTGEKEKVAINGFNMKAKEWEKAARGKTVKLKDSVGKTAILKSSGSLADMSLDNVKIFGITFKTVVHQRVTQVRCYYFCIIFSSAERL